MRYANLSWLPAATRLRAPPRLIFGSERGGLIGAPSKREPAPLGAPLASHEKRRSRACAMSQAMISAVCSIGPRRKISGTPIVTGLYTLLLPVIAFALLGGSRHLVVSADSATAAILASMLVGIAALGSPCFATCATRRWHTRLWRHDPRFIHRYFCNPGSLRDVPGNPRKA